MFNNYIFQYQYCNNTVTYKWEITCIQWIILPVQPGRQMHWWEKSLSTHIPCLQGLVLQRSIFSWQRLPVNPGGHAHLKSAMTSVQLAPSKQGRSAQSSKTDNHLTLRNLHISYFEVGSIFMLFHSRRKLKIAKPENGVEFYTFFSIFWEWCEGHLGHFSTNCLCLSSLWNSAECVCLSIYCFEIQRNVYVCPSTASKFNNMFWCKNDIDSGSM